MLLHMIRLEIEYQKWIIIQSNNRNINKYHLPILYSIYLFIPYNISNPCLPRGGVRGCTVTGPGGSKRPMNYPIVYTVHNIVCAYIHNGKGNGPQSNIVLHDKNSFREALI